MEKMQSGATALAGQQRVRQAQKKRGQERLIDEGGGAHATYDTKRNVKKLTNVRAL